jgi:hypothetical protein
MKCQVRKLVEEKAVGPAEPDAQHLVLLKQHKELAVIFLTVFVGVTNNASSLYSLRG